MNEKSNISVILPMYEMNPELEKYFSLAIASISNQIVLPDELIIVISQNETLKKFIDGYDFSNLKFSIRILENPGKTDFASQFNYGVQNAKTEWVTLLEVDDEFSRIYFSNVIKYREAYPDVNTFLPIIVEVDEKGNFNSISNEACWAAEFCDELGMLDKQALLNYQNFNFAGMAIRKSVIDEYFGIKTNIKLTFMYEFLLRLTHFDTKVMIIPKIGYKHVNQRPGSLFNNYKQTMTPDEAKWWLAQAKKEYYFTHDNREMAYSEPINNQS